MTFKWSSVFEKHETRPTPPQVYNWRIYWSAILASWVAVIIGYDAGFAGGMVSLNSFKREFGFTDTNADDYSWTSETIISLFQAGAFFGALLTYPLASKYGRVITLWIACGFLLIGSGIQLAANGERGLSPMYAGRFLSGFGIGSVSNIAPMYVGEISPPAIRGRLIGFYEISWQVGGIFGFWINYGTSINIPATDDKQWIIPVALQLIPCGIFGIGLITLKESPRWLFSENKKQAGIRNLCYLRNLPQDHEYIQYEMKVLDEEMIEKASTVGVGLWDPIAIIIKSPNLLKRLALSTSFFIFQNSMGINAINYYSPKIFQTMGVSSLDSSLLSTGIFGLIKGFMCFVWSMVIVDRFGRRITCIIGLLFCSLCMWYVGAYVKIADPASRIASGNNQMDSGGRASLALLYLWTCGYGLSLSGTPWVWNSEVFDANIRTATSAINAASNWFWAFILARFTNQMINSMKYGIFFFFAALQDVLIPVFWALYPETKNIPIEYMDELFKYKAWNAHEKVLDKIQLDLDEEEEQKRQGVNVFIEGKPEVEQISIVETEGLMNHEKSDV